MSKHFKSLEFACHCCGKEIEMNPKLLFELEAIHAHFDDAPITVLSGYRCPHHNKEVGGAKHSQHMIGTAADIFVKGHPPAEVQHYLRQKYTGKYGIGSYHTFTHFDVRNYMARWRA